MDNKKLVSTKHKPNSKEGQAILNSFIVYTIKGFRVEDFPLEQFITTNVINSKRFNDLKRRYKALKIKHKNKF